MADHPRRTFRGLNSDLKSLVRRINCSGELRCKDFGVLAWNCLFRPLLGSFWGIFFPCDVTHRSDPQKALPWAEIRHLSHSAQESVRRFDLGAWPRKKNSITKSHKGVIFPLFGRFDPKVAQWVMSAS